MRLRHRGPDGCGTHADVGVGLVHTRLSLVDLDERSNQPFWDASRRHCLLFNGELYDYSLLRTRLGRDGVTFRTTSDTEVLLEALIRYGVEATLPQLEGMFAFALYDTREKSLVLARDRFGIKPLFIHDSAATFAFASTVDAMSQWLAFQPDPLTVSSYLQGFNGPMSGRSFYEGVRIVAPGGIVRVTLGGRAKFTQCLTMNDLVDPGLAEELAQTPVDQMIDEVERRLLRGVETQLQADVPVGAFCSGGVDSSLLMAMAARIHTDLKVFHADIVGSLSERSAAERLARHLKLDLQSVPVRDADFVESIPDVVEHFAFPFAAHQTSVPLLMVSGLVHEHGIKAVLCGEGADECFLGYPWLAPNVREALGRLPGRLFGGLRRSRTPSGGYSMLDRELVRGMASQFEYELGPTAYGEAGSRSAAQQRSKTSLASDGELSYILRGLLHRNDSMGMASSVEARFPFLDSRLVNLAMNLPEGLKVKFAPGVLDAAHPFFRDKWILRQVAARYLPADLSQRQKRMLPTSAFSRFQIANGFFEDSFVSDWFGLARTPLRYLLESAGPPLRLRLLHLDAWGDVCIRKTPKAQLASRLARHVQVAAA